MDNSYYEPIPNAFGDRLFDAVREAFPEIMTQRRASALPQSAYIGVHYLRARNGYPPYWRGHYKAPDGKWRNTQSHEATKDGEIKAAWDVARAYDWDAPRLRKEAT